MNFSESAKNAQDHIVAGRTQSNIDFARSMNEGYSLPPKGTLSFDVEAEKPTQFQEFLTTVAPCVFKKKEAFGEGLTIHHSLITTRRKFKPWDQLTEEERKQKVQYLWFQTRRYFWQQVILSRIAKSNEANIQVTVIDEDEVLEQ